LKAKLIQVLGDDYQGDRPIEAPVETPVPTAETSTTEAEFAQVFESKDTDTKATASDDDDLEDYFKSLAAD
jgi:hypothetical protein